MHGSGEEAADARARKLAALAASVAPQVEADPARVLQHIQGSMPMTLDEMRDHKARELGIWEKDVHGYKSKQVVQVNRATLICCFQDEEHEFAEQ